MANFLDHPRKREILHDLKQRIEKDSIAKHHKNTLEKRGIFVGDVLNPSIPSHSQKIQYKMPVTFRPGRSIE